MTLTAKLFSKEQRASIDQAVVEAESRTSGEIIPVIASASGRYDRPEDIFGLWVGAAAMAVTYLVIDEAERGTGNWDGVSSLGKLVLMLLALAGGFALGAITAGFYPTLRRPFTPKSQMRDEVNARARQAFYDGRVYRTDKGTGVLIYISLFERMVVVLADDRVIEKLGRPALDELCAQMTGGLKHGDVTATMCAAIKATGDRLASIFPRDPNDKNELPNALVLVD
ncbi:MAG: hypothetical protein K8S99_07840 [Planctomycetes bacterium]|nr:hypothetical protein [Planctomycetota bacterium]